MSGIIDHINRGAERCGNTLGAATKGLTLIEQDRAAIRLAGERKRENALKVEAA